MDESTLASLIEESEDTHADAMVETRAALDETVELGHERRRQGVIDPDEGGAAAGILRGVTRRALLAGGALAAAAFGPVLLGLTEAPAFAAAGTDVQMLQTAAAIEILAVSTYTTALTLPYIGGSTANPTVKAFATTTRSQHAQHRAAFNAAAKALGGTAQTKAASAYVPGVDAAVKKITKESAAKGTLSVVALALTLENVAAETYVAYCSKYTNTNPKKVTASIMGVEAQHVATLIAVQTLLMAGAASLITLSPTVVSKLPAGAGSIGFPNAFYKTDAAASVE